MRPRNFEETHKRTASAAVVVLAANGVYPLRKLCPSVNTGIPTTVGLKMAHRVSEMNLSKVLDKVRPESSKGKFNCWRKNRIK